MVFYAPALWGPGRRVAPGRVVIQGPPGDQVVVEVQAADRPRTGDRVLDGLLVPGLVDLHCHIGRGWGPFGVDPIDVARSGVTTCCAQGDVGAPDLDAWVRETRRRELSIYLALNLSPHGETEGVGALRELPEDAVAATAAAARKHAAVVKMISVNLGRRSLGSADPLPVLELAISAAHASGLPLMVGLAEPGKASLTDQLDLLRPGDVVTYSFRSEPWSLVRHGTLVDGIERAHRRGVLFDVSHGLNSFDPSVAREAMAAGMVPDTISSDLQASGVGTSEPLPVVLSAVMRTGLSLERALMASTRTPAAALGLPNHVGALVPGRSRSLTVLSGPTSSWRGHTLLTDGTTSLAVRG